MSVGRFSCGERASASVEQAGLVALIAALVLGSIAIARGGGDEADEHLLGSAIGRKIRCGAVGPGPCWRDPLTAAYGRPLAGWVRASAPLSGAVTGPEGALSPVDFRRCRRASCAIADPARPGLTLSNRRITLFVSVDDGRRSARPVVATYWAYRPALGWSRSRVRGEADAVAALAATPLLESDVPVLVPLETLAGRNHIAFAADEEPPWRWLVESR